MLDRHLLSRLVPASVSLAQENPQYNSDDVSRWLHTIAFYLNNRHVHDGGNGNDIELHTLWTAVRLSIVRYMSARLMTISALFALVAADLLMRSTDYVAGGIILPLFYQSPYTIELCIMVLLYIFWRSSGKEGHSAPRRGTKIEDHERSSTDLYLSYIDDI